MKISKAKLIVVSFVAMFGVATATLAPAVTVGASPASDIQTGVDASGGGGQASLGTQIKTVVNILLYILGAIAVVMIVIGGVRYTTSNGDSGAIKSAKDTILYSVVGLVVAILAYSIVNFVLSQFK